jgi:hypothetical protein
VDIGGHAAAVATAYTCRGRMRLILAARLQGYEGEVDTYMISMKNSRRMVLELA